MLIGVCVCGGERLSPDHVADEEWSQLEHFPSAIWLLDELFLISVEECNSFHLHKCQPLSCAHSRLLSFVGCIMINMEYQVSKEELIMHSIMISVVKCF